MMNLMGIWHPYDCQNVKNIEDALEFKKFNKDGRFFDFKSIETWFNIIFDLGIGFLIVNTSYSINYDFLHDLVKEKQHNPKNWKN